MLALNFTCTAVDAFKGKCFDECIISDNYLSWNLPGVGRYLPFMALQSIAFFLILFIIEKVFVGRRSKLNRVSQAILAEKDGMISEDSDVANERQRIQSHPIQVLVKTDTVITH